MSEISNPALVLITYQISSCSSVNSYKIFLKNFAKTIKKFFVNYVNVKCSDI